mgnify:CR=1 FL=1
MSVLFAYPGQGAQRPGMLAALPDEPPVRACLEQAADCLGQAPAELESAEALRGTRAVQLCLLIAGVAASRLLETRQIKKMIASYVGENKLFAQQYLSGELELEFNPQGTLAERIRAGGAGIPAFFTKTGVGTLIAEGKEVREFDGEKYVMERGLFADLAIVHAWKGDTAGNLVYRKTARNFNPMMATAAKITIAEVEHLVPAGEIDPDHIHTAGVFVKRMIEVGTAKKRIEFRNTRPRPAA